MSLGTDPNESKRAGHYPFSHIGTEPNHRLEAIYKERIYSPDKLHGTLTATNVQCSANRDQMLNTTGFKENSFWFYNDDHVCKPKYTLNVTNSLSW